MNVVEVLRVGVSGLVFLLALLSYRLLVRAVDGKASASVLRTIRFYLIASFAIAALIGGLAAVQGRSGLVSDNLRAQMGTCRDSLARLQTQAERPGLEIQDLRVGIARHAAICTQIVEQGDAK
jgi:hypothetical protein